MSFNVTNLTDYTQKATELLRSFALYADNFANYDIMTSIQHKQYLNYLDANPYIQAGACGGSTSGSTILDEKTITVVPMMFRDSFCIDDLNKKDLNFNTGTLNGVMIPDLQTSLIADESAKIKKIIDNVLWNGSISGGDLMDGWVTEIAADSDVIGVTTGQTATVSNIDDILQEMALAVTEAIWARGEMLTIHMPLAYYNLYKVNRVNSNFFHDDPKGLGLLQMDFYGWESQIKIQAEPGLAGTKTMILTQDKNLVIGTDDVFEVSKAIMYYDIDTDYVKYKSSFKLGNTYKFSEEIVYFIGA